MRSVVVYESMFGNTHRLADAIAEGLAPAGEVRVVPVSLASRELVRDAELVVVGGPTHVHGLSRPATRHNAAQMAAREGSDLVLEPGAGGWGLREWLAELSYLPRLGAAFDTRAHGSPVLTGRASRTIGRRLHAHGLVLVRRPESFLVDGHNHLLDGELDRARAWGARLAASVHDRMPALA